MAEEQYYHLHIAESDVLALTLPKIKMSLRDLTLRHPCPSLKQEISK
jgi:hypothetical protein